MSATVIPGRLLAASLLATRDTLMASVAQIDAALIAIGVDDEPISGECPHPLESIRDDSTLGHDGPYTCTACGLTQDSPFHTED